MGHSFEEKSYDYEAKKKILQASERVWVFLERGWEGSSGEGFAGEFVCTSFFSPL